MRETPTNILLNCGWLPWSPELDAEHVVRLLAQDGWQFTAQTMKFFSEVFTSLGDEMVAPWFRPLNIFGARSQDALLEFQSYLTQDPRDVNRLMPLLIDFSPTEPSFKEYLALETIRRMEIYLGKPSRILQLVGPTRQFWATPRWFQYPPERYDGYQSLDLLGLLSVQWDGKAALTVNLGSFFEQSRIQLRVSDRTLIDQAAIGMAVQSVQSNIKVGSLRCDHSLESFDADVQAFTADIRPQIVRHEKSAVLVHGQPGTGKTSWCLAIAKEILEPLGFVTFILDHQSFRNFQPPSFLRKICVIVNDIDGLAPPRSGGSDGRTEAVLSLLDGNTINAVVPVEQADVQIVFLLTCNSVEQIDSAALRRGRVDFMHEFLHHYVEGLPISSKADGDGGAIAAHDDTINVGNGSSP